MQQVVYRLSLVLTQEAQLLLASTLICSMVSMERFIKMQPICHLVLYLLLG